jgi:hypothetical protein
MKAKINIKNFKKFEKYARSYCEKHNKTITLVPRKSVFQKEFKNFKCAGFCDGDEMVIATKNPNFYTVFIHEFAHLTQAVERIPMWYECGDIWSALQNGKVSLAQWDDFVKVIALERDCERRALNLIKKFNITSLEIYAIKANIYLYYYQYVFLTKRWNRKKSIYECQDIHDLMPDILLSARHFNNINMEVMTCFFDYYKR